MCDASNRRGHTIGLLRNRHAMRMAIIDTAMTTPTGAHTGTITTIDRHKKARGNPGFFSPARSVLLSEQLRQAFGRYVARLHGSVIQHQGRCATHADFLAGAIVRHHR